MHLKEQEYVVELANSKNITKAAKNLFMTQPALSLFLTNLESSLGTPLFKRMGRTLILTYAGELYVEKARQMLRLKQEFDYALNEVVNNLKGRIRIGLFSRQTPVLLPPVLGAFKKQYPQIEVSIEEHSFEKLEQLLYSGEIDFIICNYDMENADFSCITLFYDDLLLALPENHPMECFAVETGELYPWIDLNLLKEETFFLQFPNQNIRKFADRAFAYTGFKPDHVFLVNSIDAGVQMAAEGLGAAFTLKLYTKSYYYHKKVNYYKIGDSKDKIPFSVLYLKGMPLTSYTHDFIGLIKDVLMKEFLL